MADVIPLQNEFDDSATDGSLPFSMFLELTVRDRDTIAELSRYPEGDERDQFALNALRIGVLALRQARGQIDVEAVRRESERLLEGLQARLENHSALMHDRLSGTLKQYFDPQDGRFHERVNRLIGQDGELECLLRRQIAGEESELFKTLMAHFGDGSPLMKLLSPDQSQGLLAALRETVEEQLRCQREHVLSQFSLDNKEGALARFIAELTDRHGALSSELHVKLDDVVRQFSLDEEDSALSRLVRNVEQAQRRITSEFSLDSEESALARLKREILKLFGEQREANQRFQEEVKGALQAMAARRAEADRSTRHGVDFEQDVLEMLQREAQKFGDIATDTTSSSGLIRNCKVGDCVIELGPESAAPGAKIAVEAKEKINYQLSQAREEIETARKNRDAQVGLFVFSKRNAPAGLEPVTRCGDDVFVTWDAADPATDLFLCVGFNLARALCVRTRQSQAAQAADFTEIDSAILEIEKQVGVLDDVDKWAGTIQNNSEKILNKVASMRKSLQRELEILREKTDALKGVVGGQN